jgi:hypothetical protein
MYGQPQQQPQPPQQIPYAGQPPPPHPQQQWTGYGAPPPPQ